MVDIIVMATYVPSFYPLALLLDWENLLARDTPVEQKRQRIEAGI